MDGNGIRFLACAGLLLGLVAPACRAEDTIWRPVAVQPAAAKAPAPSAPIASIGRPEPLAMIGRPVAVTQPADALALPVLPGTIFSANYTSGAAAPAVIRCEAPGDVQPVQLSGPPPVAGLPPPPPPPPPSPYGDQGYNPSASPEQPLNKTFGDRGRDWLGVNAGGGSTSCNRQPFQSDHAFDGLISPVSNPFFFEDPRSLTEVKPLFMYQSVPHSDPYFMGGSAEFFGVQGRLALNENWSVVISKLGFVSIQPHFKDDTLHDATGFATVDLGPKWTFFRNEQGGGVAAAGLNFDIAAGDKSVFQNTGNLALDPYITYGKNFGRLPSGYGSFNFMGELGYFFGVDNKQAEFFHSSFHLDYDVANLHKFYPLIELNWFHYTKRGTERDVGTEGADLINFGSSSIDDGRDLVRLDFGARYKFSECIQLGSAFEFPLTSQKGLSDFRWTIDVIFRY